jgi:hypothetical protein
MASFPDDMDTRIAKLRLELAEAGQEKKRRTDPPSPPSELPPGKGVAVGSGSVGAAIAQSGKGGSGAGAAGSGASAGPVRTYVGEEGAISELPRKRIADLTESKLQEFVPAWEVCLGGWLLV